MLSTVVFTRGSQFRRIKTSGLSYRSCIARKLFVSESKPRMSTTPAKYSSPGASLKVCSSVTCVVDSLFLKGGVSEKSLFASQFFPVPFCPIITKIGFTSTAAEANRDMFSAIGFCAC